MSAVPLDVLPPWHKPVQHELVLELAPGLPNVRIVAGPLRGFGTFEAVEAGVPFEFSSKYGTRLFAVPADVPLPASLTADWLEVFPASGGFAEVSSVPVGRPLERVVTTYRVTAIEGRAVATVRVDEARFDSGGHVLGAGISSALLLTLALLGALGLRMLARSAWGLSSNEAGE